MEKRHAKKHGRRTFWKSLTAVLVVIFALGGCVLGALVLFGSPEPGAQPSGDFSSGDSAVSTVESGPKSAPLSSEPASSAASEDPDGIIDGIFAEGYSRAGEKLAQMTEREMVGQLFLFRYPGESGVQTVTDYRPGGYFFFAADFEKKTAEQVSAMIEACQEAAATRLAIAVDEEGGTVVRVSGFPALAPKKFQSPQQVFQSGGMEAVSADAAEKAELLRFYGINVNLAPVADVSTDPKDFIYARSFGQDAAQTSKFVEAVVRASNRAGISSVLKHFPGYGNNADTHTGSAYDQRSLQTFERSDFLPFQAGIDAGAPCVLVSHNVVACMDPDRPASLSPQVHRVLREELGFTGVVMTDDLAMGAVRQYAGEKSAAVAALLAGNDLLLSSDITGDFDAVYAAVQTGEVSRERLKESALRVLAWKYTTGILSD